MIQAGRRLCIPLLLRPVALPSCFTVVVTTRHVAIFRPFPLWQVSAQQATAIESQGWSVRAKAAVMFGLKSAKLDVSAQGEDVQAISQCAHPRMRRAVAGPGAGVAHRAGLVLLRRCNGKDWASEQPCSLPRIGASPCADASTGTFQ